MRASRLFTALAIVAVTCALTITTAQMRLEFVPCGN